MVAFMEEKRTKRFITVITTCVLMGLGLLVIRVVDLQGFQGQVFVDISQDNRQFRSEIPAERGVFFDRYGDPLVMNQKAYFQLLRPAGVYSEKTPISVSEALALQVESPLAVEYSLQRYYFRPFSLAHILGYVSGVTADNLQENPQLGQSDVVGKFGLEGSLDERMRGKKGFREFEVNALGEKITVSRYEKEIPGQSIKTTLDPYLSTVAWKAMGNKTGSVVILDADTGKILTIVSTPSFNSNLFTPSLGAEQQRQEELQKALTDEKKLFFNRAVSGLYPPGSIFKLVTALAGLESGAFTQETEVDDQGTLEVGEYSFANWYYTQYGRTEGVITLVRAISRSNDIFFYRAAEWTGVDALVQRAEEMGFGKLTGVEISGEKPGLVPNPTWKEKTLGERWFLGNTFHMGIGQGDLLVTPLQQAQMVQVFGNGGKLCKPHLLESDRESECSSLGVQEKNLEIVREGMINACSSGGTAFPFFPWNDQRKGKVTQEMGSEESASSLIRNGVVACKTGTAEFGAQDQKGHRNTHAWFAMTVGGVQELLQDQLKALLPDIVSESTASATLAEADRTTADEKKTWLEKVNQSSFPDTLAIVVLVESDDQQPFAEGSKDGAPVALQIWKWMMGTP